MGRPGSPWPARQGGGWEAESDYCRDGEPEAGRGTGQPKPTAAAERSQGKRASSTARPGEAQQRLGLFPPFREGLHPRVLTLSPLGQPVMPGARTQVGCT